MGHRQITLIEPKKLMGNSKRKRGDKGGFLNRNGITLILCLLNLLRKNNRIGMN